ncbi:PQQ-dependent catabolism-associated CXXCW motif protein [Citreicella sp. C3M06]|uniref:PQQ-dependent catabolism-associated CXXCW motif protein n=1 Tax=Citreicella sp. C3M06 TaxID=2841564 RepID=UPI001C09F1D7|nr:PQQ-dependent catabolism-associated CXXCW motif protein [Citreicella sp. C3M06]MBU2961075.1 PQQ-dependent catabolism-associated CXXCW motif protein [Citreicella sp. C3M06]
MRLALALMLLPALAVAQEPDGFRMAQYRAPVPETLSGATVVSAQDAHALWQQGAAFIDVLPRPPKPDTLPEGTIWREEPRQSIPGATWLPNVGYGEIAEVTDAYFRAGLDHATGGDRARQLVIFCLDDCWMSWNAAKRALGYGYSAVAWMPTGTDGWSAEDYPTEQLHPWHPG